MSGNQPFGGTPVPGSPTQAPGPPPMQPQQLSSGLAIASLILGCLSFVCFGPLCSIPAIITGHIAGSRARNEPYRYGGQGLATAGLVLGYVNMVIFLLIMLIMPAILLPALARAREAARRSSCQNNLKEIGLVCKMFTNESKDERYPELSSQPGRLMFSNESDWYKSPIYPEYLTDLSILLCPSDDDASLLSPTGAGSDPDLMLDDHSYFYLGYAVNSDEDVRVFAEAYRRRVSEGLRFNEDLDVAPGQGSRGGDTLYLLREGIERFLATDINNPAACAMAQAIIPILIERPDNHTPRGGNVLFMDGHVEFIRYPGKWPMTEKTIGILEALDKL